MSEEFEHISLNRTYEWLTSSWEGAGHQSHLSNENQKDNGISPHCMADILNNMVRC